MVALMAVRGVDVAAVRCARLALGLREFDLERMLGLDPGAVAAWEEQRGPVAGGVVEALASLTATAAKVTEWLTDWATTSGEIVSYADDDEVAAATAGEITLVGMYRVCAGRAAIAVPEATVIRRDAHGDELPAWLSCVSTSWGLGLAQVQKWFGVQRRLAQYWLAGTRALPDGVIAEVQEMTAMATAHIDELVASINPDNPVLEVCASDAQMDRWWPARDAVPLVTHQVCGARAAAQVPGTRLVFVSG